jgi:predicted RNA-binding protein YlqC (UPF0109 family)
MRELVEYMVKSLVDDPNSVSVSEDDTGEEIILELTVAQEDMGRVIGRQGRVINAMRTLVQTCAARDDRRASLEIIE